MDSHEIIQKLKDISKEDSFDYSRSYREEYFNFIKEKPEFFTASEILSLSEKLGKSIPISTLINKFECNFDEKESNYKSLKSFIEKKQNLTINELLTIFIVNISNLYDYLKTFSKYSLTQIKSLTEELKITKENTRTQIESLTEELKTTNSKLNNLRKCYDLFLLQYIKDSIHNNRLEIIKSLFVNQNIRKKMKKEAFFESAENNKLDIIKYLIEEQHIDKETQNSKGMTCIDLACLHRSHDIIRYYFSTVNEKPPNYESNIFKACCEGNLHSLQYHLEVLKENKESTTNFTFANQLTYNNLTVLHIASAYGHLRIVQYLFEIQHINTESKDEDGRTALNFACYFGQYSIVQYLIKICKVNPNTTTRIGMTALHEACSEGYLPIVKYLIEAAKVDKEAKDNEGITALHCACFYNYLPIVKYLIETAKVDKEAKDNEGITALHAACSGGHLPIVEYLIEKAKVDTEVKDNYRRTVYSTANSEIRKYLESIGIKN